MILHSLIRSPSIFLYCGKLTQQFIVDVYCKIESARLNCVRNNPKQLQVDYYCGLHNYIRNRAQVGGYRVGKAVILPSTFQGSPRDINQNYQDAMAVVARLGKPDAFITFTCNPNWPEMTENLQPLQTPNDRPDLVARVFNQKLSTLL